MLCVRYFDGVKGTPFYRLLGGGIEFGELSEVALVREIREEVGAEIDNIEFLQVVENIFVHEGKPGHEVVFLYKAGFVDGRFYVGDVLPMNENGVEMEACWMSVATFLGEGAPPLYPDGALDFLVERKA